MTKLAAATAAVCLAWSATLLGAVTVRAASPVETVLVLTPVVHGYEILAPVIQVAPVPAAPVEVPATIEHVERYALGSVTLGPATTEIDRPEPPSVYVSAPHTHAGLVAWLATLRWPWGPIGTCESVRDDSWRETSSSYARGVFQFLPSTWASLGLTGDPAASSWRDQLKAAIRLRARDGLGAWVCARILGFA